MNCAEAELEKSFPLEAVSKVCRGKDAGKDHSRQQPEQRQACPGKEGDSVARAQEAGAKVVGSEAEA